MFSFDISKKLFKICEFSWVKDGFDYVVYDGGIACIGIFSMNKSFSAIEFESSNAI